MVEYLFSFKGRSDRLAYFLFFLFWVVLYIVFGFSIIFLGLLSPAFLIIGFIALFIAMIVSSFAITTRRLHDLNLSGWVYPIVTILPNIIILGLGFGIGMYGAGMEAAAKTALIEKISFASVIVYVNTLVFSLMLMIWPGSDEPNRFG